MVEEYFPSTLQLLQDLRKERDEKAKAEGGVAGGAVEGGDDDNEDEDSPPTSRL